MRAWPMKAMRIPATGPKRVAINARRPYWMEIVVFGTGLGIATNLPRTKKRAAPIPMATIVTTGDFLFIIFPSFVNVCSNDVLHY